MFGSHVQTTFHPETGVGGIWSIVFFLDDIQEAVMVVFYAGHSASRTLSPGMAQALDARRG